MSIIFLFHFLAHTWGGGRGKKCQIFIALNDSPHPAENFSFCIYAISSKICRSVYMTLGHSRCSLHVLGCSLRGPGLFQNMAFLRKWQKVVFNIKKNPARSIPDVVQRKLNSHGTGGVILKVWNKSEHSTLRFSTQEAAYQWKMGKSKKSFFTKIWRSTNEGGNRTIVLETGQVWLQPGMIWATTESTSFSPRTHLKPLFKAKKQGFFSTNWLKK